MSSNWLRCPISFFSYISWKEKTFRIQIKAFLQISQIPWQIEMEICMKITEEMQDLYFLMKHCIPFY